MKQRCLGTSALGLLAALAAVAGCKSRSSHQATPAIDAAQAGDARLPGDAARDATSDAAPGQTGSAVGTGAVGTQLVPGARVEHVLWSVVDNRAMAHRTIGGALWLSAAEPSFVRYAGLVPPRQWTLGERIDNVLVALPNKTAELTVPFGANHADVKAVVLRGHGTAGTTLSFWWDDQLFTKAILVDGWQNVVLPLPAPSTVAVPKASAAAAKRPAASGALPNAVGEHTLRIAVAAKASKPKRAKAASGVAPATTNRSPSGSEPAPFALAWVQFATSTEPVTDATDQTKQVMFDAVAKSLRFGVAGAEAAYYVAIPEGGHLVGDVAGPADCALAVRASAADGSFAGGVMQGAGARLDLTKMAGQVVRLALASECPDMRIANAGITSHGPQPADRQGVPPKYIVLWVFDATRADRISTFTPGAVAETPTLAELAKTGTAFRQYYVQGNESQTSHSSVWTSLYPAVHEVRTAGVGGYFHIRKHFNIIGDELTKAGFVTAAVTGNGYVTQSGGYARGFSEFRNMMREKGISSGVLFGDKIVAAATKRLQALKDQPTFLFLGTVDAHAPWIARKPWIDRYSPGPYTGPFQDVAWPKDLGFKPGSMGCGIIPPPVDVTRLKAIYDSAISYQDDLLGKFVAQLKAWGIWDQTMLIVTADHGDEFFEDRRCGHGGSTRDTLVRVPLLIHYPALFPGGFVDEGVDGVDILPTILQAVKQPLFATAQGMSVIGLANGEGRGWLRPSYASQYEYAHTMRLGAWKLRVPKRGAPIMHDFRSDPNEQVDASRGQPFARRMLVDAMATFLASRTKWQKSKWGVASNLTADGAAALDSFDGLDKGWLAAKRSGAGDKPVAH